VELSDAPRSRRPTTAVTPALLLRADKLIRKDRRITTRKLATELSSSKGSVNNVIDALGYAKVCARWIPRNFTDDHKTVRKKVCSDFLSRYEAEGGSFLSRVVTGDKTCITLNRRSKDSQWNGIIQLLLGGRSLRLSLQQGKSWPRFLGYRKGDFGRHYATWSNH
jgi:hypothetical protein